MSVKKKKTDKETESDATDSEDDTVDLEMKRKQCRQKSNKDNDDLNVYMRLNEKEKYRKHMGKASTKTISFSPGYKHNNWDE